MNWKPVKDVLICKKHIIEEKHGSLYLPDQPKKINHMWDVVAAGNDVKWVEKETVILDGLGGLNVEIDGEDYRIVNIKHVLAVKSYGS